ncbi:MAG: hypothetical protein DRP64_01685 [Verrucomicrobia bacterium]|nr:MAG: hypothetical protein DRP64_01685 [Verrucomicrobiota bacterium]
MGKTNEVSEFIRNKPEKERLQEYTSIVEYIDRKLAAGEKAGMAAFGGAALFAETLGREAEFEGLIEKWFDRYCNVDPMLADWIYKLKTTEEWHALFSSKYHNLTNERVRYRMRVYAFSERLVLSVDGQKNMQKALAGLDVTLLSVGSDKELRYVLQIRNTSDHETFVFPQTKKVVTEWSRKDGVLLPYEKSFKDMWPKYEDVVFLFPGDSLVREFKMERIGNRKQVWHSGFNSISPRRKGGYFFINGMCVALDDETTTLEIKGTILPFSEEQQGVLKNEIKERYGVPKASHIHVVGEPVYSNAIEVFASKGSILLK